MMRKVCIILMLMLLSPMVIFATSGETFENEVLSGGIEESTFENKTDILYKSNGENIMLVGDIVNADGAAEDLILLVGESINSKAIGEYAFMVANNLNISGDVLKDNFVAGNNIDVTGNIGRDAYLFGSTINIDGTVGRNLYIYGSEVNINGVINGSIYMAAERIFISSDASISGDVEIEAKYIEIEDGVKIGGLVTYNSNIEEVIIPNNVINNMNQVVDIDVKKENVFLSEVKNIIMWLLINLVLFAVTMLISPGLFERIEKAFKEKEGILYGTSIVWGIVLLILIPIIAIIALITVIGSALGFVAILAYIVIFVYSTVITGYLLGTTLFADKNMNKYLVGIIGIIAIEILRRLPVIGGLISFVIMLIAFGLIKEIIKKEKVE